MNTSNASGNEIGNSDIPTQRDLYLIVFYSLLGGATALIPIPFVDDWIFARLRKFMARNLLRQTGIAMTSEQARFLIQRPSEWKGRGCVYKAALAIFVLPLKTLGYVFKKVFRKIVFILAIHDSTERASSTFHHAYLLTLAGRKRSSDSQLDDVSLIRMREAINETLLGWDTSPVRNIFKKIVKVNRQILFRAGRSLLSLRRRIGSRPSPDSDLSQVVELEERLLEDVTAATTESLLGERGYLTSLEKRFTTHARAKGLL
ncbi:MAG TPA: hypothetical protein VMY18_14200 [Acidobacteriota bacterium]|nr:hypothetical protein [Acidobacteriota bacterium]